MVHLRTSHIKYTPDIVSQFGEEG